MGVGGIFFGDCDERDREFNVYGEDPARTRISSRDINRIATRVADEIERRSERRGWTAEFLDGKKEKQ